MMLGARRAKLEKLNKLVTLVRLIELLDHDRRPAHRNDSIIAWLTANPEKYQRHVRMSKAEFDALYDLCKYDDDPLHDSLTMAASYYNNYWRLFVVVERMCLGTDFRSVASHWQVAHGTVFAWMQVWVPRIVTKLDESAARLDWFTLAEQLQFKQYPVTDPRSFHESIGIVDGVVIKIQMPRTDRERARLARRYKNKPKGWGISFLAVYDRMGFCRYLSPPRSAATSELDMLNYVPGLQHRLTLLADRLFPGGHPSICRAFKEKERARHRHNQYLRVRMNEWNQALSSERSLIERQFGQLKERFRILHGTWLSDWAEVGPVMRAAVLISNFIMIQRRSFITNGIPLIMLQSMEGKCNAFGV